MPKKLRVGLVSGDFRNHPVGYFLENILAHINMDHIELLAYSTNSLENSLTSRLKRYFSCWSSLVGLADDIAAEMIYSHGIHVLIDLSGHTAHNRLPIFAWKPAPVQASWLGYFASTGVPGIDYLVADLVSVPEIHQAHFSEKIYYLTDTRLCFTPPQTSLLPSDLPALHNEFLTFGCFQNAFKINDRVLVLWAKIMRALPDARLRLQNEQMACSVTRDRLLARFSDMGISPQRISIYGKVSRDAYLNAYSEVDVVLDTFPYPGGTTTCEGLWMGVPTLTLQGDTLLSRQGASLLTAAGLSDWVADDEDQYVEKAVFIAKNLQKLAALRANLREQVKKTPLFDAERFAVEFECMLWNMWKNPDVAACANDESSSPRFPAVCNTAVNPPSRSNSKPGLSASSPPIRPRPFFTEHCLPPITLWQTLRNS